MSKDIVFYSNYCNYSKDIISTLSKSHLHKSLVYICVDDKNIKLPNFITVVPTVYLNNEKRILVDNEISSWIEQNTQQSKGDEELMAYYGSSMGTGGFSTSFSFIEDGVKESDMISQYSFLDGPSQSIETPKEFTGNRNNNSNNSRRGGSSMDKAYEQLQQARNNESFSQGVRRI